MIKARHSSVCMEGSSLGESQPAQEPASPPSVGVPSATDTTTTSATTSCPSPCDGFVSRVFCFGLRWIDNARRQASRTKRGKSPATLKRFDRHFICGSSFFSYLCKSIEYTHSRIPRTLGPQTPRRAGPRPHINPGPGRHRPYKYTDRVTTQLPLLAHPPPDGERRGRRAEARAQGWVAYEI